MQPNNITTLNQTVQDYLEKEAASFLGFMAKGVECERHHCSPELNHNLQVICPACYEEALSHVDHEGWVGDAI